MRNPRLLLQEILRGFTPQNDIIQQRAITTNERFFLPTVVRMTAFPWATFPMSFRARPAGRRGISDFLLFEILHFAYAPFRMTVFRNFFPDAKKLPRKVAPCHSEPRPMVECEESPPSYSKRWRLYSRLAGDASLSLSMTYAWGEILRCSTPRNDKQMSFRTYVRNPRLFV